MIAPMLERLRHPARILALAVPLLVCLFPAFALGAAADLDAARLFIPMAMRRTRRAIRALERNADELMRKVAQRALDTGDLTVPTPTDVA